MTEAVGAERATNYRSIALVAGYHPCSFPPPEAYDAGLKERFAVVLSSFRPDKGEMFFDADLFVRLAEAVLRVIPHDSLDVETGGGSPGPRSLSELAALYADRDEADRDPPTRMRVFLGGRLVAVGESESWAAVGGPAPYHDSFTLSLYTTANRAAEFRVVCVAACGGCGAAVTAFYEAKGRKQPFVPWWRRPLRWLGMKPW